MKISLRPFFITALTIVFWGITICFTPIQNGDALIAVIICADNPVAFKDNPSLTANEVKSYFLRKTKKSWPETNKNILPVDRKKMCAEQLLFYTKVLHMDAYEVANYFINKQYQHGTPPPVKFSSDKEIIDFVGEEIGAIGYININALTAEARTKVKVVLTINE